MCVCTKFLKGGGGGAVKGGSKASWSMTLGKANDFIMPPTSGAWVLAWEILILRSPVGIVSQLSWKQWSVSIQAWLAWSQEDFFLSFCWWCRWPAVHHEVLPSEMTVCAFLYTPWCTPPILVARGGKAYQSVETKPLLPVDDKLQVYNYSFVASEASHCSLRFPSSSLNPRMKGLEIPVGIGGPNPISKEVSPCLLFGVFQNL